MINKINLDLINQTEERDFSSKINFEFAGRKKENTFGVISSIYSRRDYNRLYPNQIFFREHLPIFLK